MEILLSVMMLLNAIHALGTGDILRRHLQWPAVREMCGRRELACANAANMTRVCTVRRSNGNTEYRDYRNPCLLFLSNMCDQPGEEFFIAWDSSCASYRRTIRNDNFEGIANKSGSIDSSKSTDLLNKTTLNSGKNINKSLENVRIFKESLNKSEENNKMSDKNNMTKESVNGSQENTNNSQKENVTNYQSEVDDSDKNMNESSGNLNGTEVNENDINNTDSSIEDSNNTEDTNTDDTNTEDTTTADNDATPEGSGDSDEGNKQALRENFVSPKYETDTSFDDLPCRYFCPDVYSPMCLIANKKHMKYMKVFSFANYCLASIYYCKYESQFKPPPKEEYEDDAEYFDVRSSPISMSFCGASRYLQFSRFSQAASAMGHYGWLNGDFRYSHILEPHERRPGYG